MIQLPHAASLIIYVKETMSFNDDTLDTILEFMRTFPTLSFLPTPVNLDDGVAFFDLLSILAPRYFDSSTVSRNVEGNWALKASNLRKLKRNMDTYFREALLKSIDFSVISIPNISRNADKDSIFTLFELIAAAAVLCDHRVNIVGQIMGMSSRCQAEMKRIIDSGLSRLKDHDTDENMELLLENKQPRQTLAETLRELTSLKKSRTYEAEELILENRRLKELSANVQERNDQSQTALSNLVRDAAQNKKYLDEAKADVVGWREKYALLQDDFEVLQAKLLHLHKTEAIAIACRKALEISNQQMQELELQSTGYLRQIINLENENKEIPELRKKLQSLNEQMQDFWESLVLTRFDIVNV